MAQEEVLCRFCFGSKDDEHALGPLFRPCLCKGTASFVHVQCLDHWRNTSKNKKSFYQCDVCNFQYKLATPIGADRLALANLITSKFAIATISLTMLAAIIFLSGFVAKALSPELTWWDVFRFYNVKHWVAGSVMAGLGSLLGALVTWAGGFGVFRFGLDVGGWRGGGLGDLLGGGSGESKWGGVLLIVLVVVGLIVALCWVFGVVERYSRLITKSGARMVLDARTGRAPTKHN